MFKGEASEEQKNNTSVNSPPGAPSPATIISACSLALYKLVHTATRAAFSQRRLIISLSCLKRASSFPFPLAGSPDILSLPKEPWWTEPVCILELTSRYLPLTPRSSKEGLCSVLPVPSQDGACLRAFALLPSWREEAPALRSSDDCLFLFRCTSLSACRLSYHSSPFVVSSAFYCILNYSSVYVNVSSSSHWLWAPGKQDIVYCVHCWTPAPGTAPAQSKTLITARWSSIWMDMQNRLIMGGPWYSTLRKILNG